MRSLILTGLMASVLSMHSMAGVYEPENETIQRKLNELSSNVSQSLKDISIQIESTQVDFPEYAAAAENLKQQLSDTSDLFEKEMDLISERFSTELSREYSELEAVKKAYEQNHNAAMKKLLNDKLERLAKKKALLQNELSARYQTALLHLIGLNNQFGYVSKIKTDFHLSPYLTLLATLGFVTSNPAVYVFGLVSPAPVYFACYLKKSYLHLDIGREEEGCFDPTTFSVMFSKGVTLKINDKAAIEEVEKQLAFSAFKSCETAGCTYLLAESYKNFINQVSKLNKDVDLTDGLELKKISFSKRTAKKSIDRMASFYGKTKEIGVYQSND